MTERKLYNTCNWLMSPSRSRIHWWCQSVSCFSLQYRQLHFFVFF